MRKLLLAATAALSFAVPAAASVLTYNFSLTGGSVTGSWSMPASPTPDFTYGIQSIFAGVNITAPGNLAGQYDFLIWDAAAYGGIAITDANGIVYRGLGNQVYSGPITAPTFITGTYNLMDYDGVTFTPNGTLTISDPSAGAVPEPASWAMLIAGFGLTGAAMRRRRPSMVAA